MTFVLHFYVMEQERLPAKAAIKAKQAGIAPACMLIQVCAAEVHLPKRARSSSATFSSSFRKSGVGAFSFAPGCNALGCH